MDSITGNAQLDAEQRLDAVDHHLSKLRGLVASGDLGLSRGLNPDQRPDSSPDVEIFGHWVLDLLGLGESDPADAVRVARTQLVGALSKRAGEASTDSHGDGALADHLAGDDLRFVDVFAGDDLVDDPDEELGVLPISYEA